MAITPHRVILLALALLVAGLAGCAGPERGRLAEMRGRTALISEAEESPPAPLDAGTARLEAFPLLFLERDARRETLEVLWPIFEKGRSSESTFLRLRPLLRRDRFRDADRDVIFPFWWRTRERRDVGPRSVDHLWPLYGIHRREIDLVSAATHHVLFPIASLRLAEGRWRARLLPVLDLSWGWLDRGWWLLPVVKAGAGRGGWQGGNRHLYILDPLFAYERFSIAQGGLEGPEDTRTEVKVLGGLLGLERSGGRTFLRLLWMRL